MWLLSKMHSSFRGVSGSLSVRSSSPFLSSPLLSLFFPFLLLPSPSSSLLSSSDRLVHDFCRTLGTFYTLHDTHTNTQHARSTHSRSHSRLSLSFSFSSTSSTSTSLYLQNARNSSCFFSTLTAPSVSSIFFFTSWWRGPFRSTNDWRISRPPRARAT